MATYLWLMFFWLIFFGAHAHTRIVHIVFQVSTLLHQRRPGAPFAPAPSFVRRSPWSGGPPTRGKHCRHDTAGFQLLGRTFQQEKSKGFTLRLQGMAPFRRLFATFFRVWPDKFLILRRPKEGIQRAGFSQRAISESCNRKLGDLLRRQLLGGFLPFPCSSLPRWMIPTTFQFFRVQTTNRSETPLSREFCMWVAQDSTLNQPRLGGSGGRVWHDSSLFTRWRGGETHRAGHGLLFATRTETRRSLQWRRYLAICAIDSCPSSTTFWQIIYMRPEMPKPFSNLGKRQSKEGGSTFDCFLSVPAVFPFP